MMYAGQIDLVKEMLPCKQDHMKALRFMSAVVKDMMEDQGGIRQDLFKDNVSLDGEDKKKETMYIIATATIK